jgi:hypothetical protein
VSGGGGGGAAGSAAGGNTGQTGAAGGAGGFPRVLPGGQGGHGRIGPQNGQHPGGGGGGGLNDGVHTAGGYGGNGQITLSYQLPTPFKTLIAHRPGFNAPAELCPFVSMGADDVPDGNTVYPVPTLIPGINARFNGTYTVYLVSNVWNNPSAARTLTVTVYAYEQTGGNSYTTATVPLSVVPNNLASPMVNLGELTLPWRLMPADSIDGYFGVAVTSSNTADRLCDVLFLDTQGSTVIIQSANTYVNYFIDAPEPNVSLQGVSASNFDRPDAVSVLDSAFVSGGPLDIDPYGSHQLLVYACEGAPAVELTYYPRYFLERSS